MHSSGGHLLPLLLQNLSDYYGGDFEEVVSVEDDVQRVTVPELVDILTGDEKQQLELLLNMSANSEDEIMRNYLIAKTFILNLYL